MRPAPANAAKKKRPVRAHQFCPHERGEEGGQATGAHDPAKKRPTAAKRTKKSGAANKSASPEEARVEEGAGAEGTPEQGSGTRRSRLINRSSRARGGYAPNDMRFETFGIVGYGHFGQFLAASLARFGNVLAYDTDDAKLEHTTEGVRSAPLEEVAAADVVILAVPFSALAGVLRELRDLLGSDTVVMDVVSTKERAGKLLEAILPPDANLLATHPLFGPPSMAQIEPGLRMVVTAERGPAAAGFRAFLEEDVGLEVVSIPPDEHDRDGIHAVTPVLHRARSCRSTCWS